MPSKTEKAELRQNAIARLRDMLKPGDSITCTVLHVASSGMSRTIMMQIAIIEDGRPVVRDISWMVAAAIGARFDDRRGGVIMGGLGMYMRFHAVYNLGRVLFPGGFGIAGTNTDASGRVTKRRPSSAASAARMVKAGYKFRGRNGDTSGWDSDGGYALDYRG